MKFEGLKTVKQGYDDLRFGVVDILVDSDRKLFMSKRVISETFEEY